MSTESRGESTQPSIFSEIFKRGNAHLRTALELGPDYFIPNRRMIHTETLRLTQQGFHDLKFRVNESQPITGTCVIGTDFSRVQLRMFDLGDNFLTQIYILRPQPVQPKPLSDLDIPAPWLSVESRGSDAVLLGVGMAIETIYSHDQSKERTLLAGEIALDNQVQIKGFEMLFERGFNPNLPTSPDILAKNLLRMINDGELVKITRYDLAEEDPIPSRIPRYPL